MPHEDIVACCQKLAKENSLNNHFLDSFIHLDRSQYRAFASIDSASPLYTAHNRGTNLLGPILTTSPTLQHKHIRQQTFTT